MGQAIIITTNSLDEDIGWSLEEAGFPTLVVPGVEDFLSFPLEEPPDIVVLDYSSIGQGEDVGVLRRCREEGLPVLALVPQDALVTYDFTQGGDDFLALPCTPQEVATRVQQLLWRATGGEQRDVRQFGDLRIDLERYEVSLRGRPVLLTYKEYRLLVLLASTPGRVYSRETLLSRVWEYDYLGGTRTVDVHIRRLRSKLAESQHSFVETIWNVGYRFRPPEKRPQASRGIPH